MHISVDMCTHRITDPHTSMNEMLKECRHVEREDTGGGSCIHLLNHQRINKKINKSLSEILALWTVRKSDPHTNVRFQEQSEHASCSMLTLTSLY